MTEYYWVLSKLYKYTNQLIGKTHIIIIVMWIAKQDIESWIAIIQACCELSIERELVQNTHHKSMFQCISTDSAVHTFSWRTNNTSCYTDCESKLSLSIINLWYSSVGRSTDIPLLEAGDYTQCLHFHALASQWQCSLHSWTVDRKIPWIKTLQMWRNKRTLSLRR